MRKYKYFCENCGTTSIPKFRKEIHCPICGAKLRNKDRRKDE